MNTLLHYGGMIVTVLFIAAVLYSMIMAIRRRNRKHAFRAFRIFRTFPFLPYRPSFLHHLTAK